MWLSKEVGIELALFSGADPKLWVFWNRGDTKANGKVGGLLEKRKTGSEKAIENRSDRAVWSDSGFSGEIGEGRK